MRLSDGIGHDDGGRDSQNKVDRDGRFETPIESDSGSPRSLEPRVYGPMLLYLLSNALLCSFCSSRERMNIAAVK